VHNHGPDYSSRRDASSKSTREITSADLLMAETQVAQAAKQWGPVMAASCMCMDPDTFLLFTADDLGYIRCFDMQNMMRDIGGEALLDPTHGSNVHLKSRCLNTERDFKSALPPVYTRHRNFLAGRKQKSMSYLGIDFVWTVQGHKDRVIFLNCISYGLISSGADRLVSLWSLHGELLGTLLQSVPVGVVNRNWSLEIDAEKIMEEEEEMLDAVLENVKELAAREDLPDIETADLTGIEIGPDAAEFSRSELRKRINVTSDILGIDFQAYENELANKKSVMEYDSVNDGDNISVNSGQSGNTVPTVATNITAGTGAGSHSPSHALSHAPSFAQLPGSTSSSVSASMAATVAATLASINSPSPSNRSSALFSNAGSIGSKHSIASKPLNVALKELKSAGASEDYDLKAASLTHLQKRRRAAKMQQLATEYATKAGMLIDVSNIKAYKIGVHEVEKHHESQLNHGHGHSHQHHDHDELLFQSHPTQSGDMNDNHSQKHLHHSSSNSSVISSVSSLTAVSAKTAVSQSSSSPLKQAASIILSQYSSTKNIFESSSSVKSSATSASVTKKRQTASGPRASTMLDRCSKYSSNDALDKALEAMHMHTQYTPTKEALHDENILKEAKRIKEMHHRLIEGQTKMSVKQLNRYRLEVSVDSTDDARESARSLPTLDRGGSEESLMTPGPDGPPSRVLFASIDADDGRNPDLNSSSVSARSN
jgi:hypothetical protein